MIGGDQLLNRAARFFPILEELKRQLPHGGTLLEIGSGSLGLGEFWSGPFVGCDLTFPTPPVRNMCAVLCSGERLPFPDSIFDAVVVSDVIEHIPPQVREAVVVEALRVARRVVIFAYPCGPKAFALDQSLYRDYCDRSLTPPVWLQEHMLHPFPNESLFSSLPKGWTRRVVPNESLQFHYWMMKREMFRSWNFLFRVMLRIVPTIVKWLLQRANHEPSYRKIFVLTRESQPA
jgi:hypothetical protein